MTRIHTYTSIARETKRKKRAVQNWYTSAKSELGQEIGEIVGSHRQFSDEEKELLLRYFDPNAKGEEAEEPITPTVHSGNHQIVLAQPDLPEHYSLEKLRTGEAIAYDDPLAVAASAIAAMDAITTAMQADAKMRADRLQQTRQAAKAIADKAQELKLEARLYQIETNQLDSQISLETANLQLSLQEIQQLGVQPE